MKRNARALRRYLRKVRAIVDAQVRRDARGRALYWQRRKSGGAP